MKQKIQDFLRDSYHGVSLFRRDDPNAIVKTLRRMSDAELRVDGNTEKTDRVRDEQFWKLLEFLHRHPQLSLQSALDLLVFLNQIRYETPWIFGGKCDQDTFEADKRFRKLPLSKQLKVWWALKTNSRGGVLNILFLAQNLKLKGAIKRIRDEILLFLERNDRRPGKALWALKASIEVFA
jgi:hypothetical protein